MLDMLHLVTVACLFAAAWLISRSAAYVARRVLVWHDRHTEAAAATVDVRIANVKRRETSVAVIRAAIAYAAFAVAIVLSIAGEKTGPSRPQVSRKVLYDQSNGIHLVLGSAKERRIVQFCDRLLREAPVSAEFMLEIGDQLFHISIRCSRCLGS